MKNKTLRLLLPLLAFSASIFAQTINPDHLKSLNPRNIGPAGMSGRVTAIDVELRNPDVIYAGTASGGVWRSNSGGISWEPIFDKMPVQSIGALKINQRNPDEIWVGTGEGNPRNSQNSGEGIFKSIDGGKNWKSMGLEKTKTIHRIVLHRDDPNTIFVGALGSAWGANDDRGVFKTTDGGKTWRKVLYFNNMTGCADLVADPENPNKLFAAMWEYGRTPWTFNSGGAGSGLYVSFDGGETWERRTSKDGLPEGNLGRLGLAVAPSKPNIVYALVEAKENALYKSTDGGFKWQKMASSDAENSNVTNRPFYYHELYVDPKNENRIISLWTYLSKSEDGGKTFQEWVGWKIHLDHHAFWISPDDPDYMIDGNDGGLNITRDGGKSWQFAENLPVGQFYHVDVDMSIPYRVCGGMQDNGSWVGPSAVWRSGGIRNADWQEVDFGDGFDVAIRPDDPRYCYAMSQGGYVSYIDIETGKSQLIRPVHPDAVELRFNWNAGFAQNPQRACGIYYGSQFLHKSLDCGQSWQIISPDLTTNDTSKLKQDKSGGLTIDATSAENHCTIIAIAPSPKDENVIWVGTDDGNLQLTRDGGKTWSNLSSKLPTVKPGSWIPYVEASKKRAGEAFVIVNDYRRNDWRPMAFFTRDFGATWSRIVDEKKVQGHALCLVQDPEVDDLLWLGTDYGLWYSLDFGATWNKWKDFPSVSVTDLKIHPRDQDLVIGTFGRAFWILDDIRPIREIARTKGKVLEKPFAAFPSPDAYLAEFRSFDGIRFDGDAVFNGDNRSPMAMLTLWVKPEKPEVKSQKEKGKSEGKSEGKSQEVKSAESKSGADKTRLEIPETKDKEAAKNPTSSMPAAPAAQAGAGSPSGAGGAGGDEKKDEKKNGKDDKVKVQIFDMVGDTVRSFSAKLDTGLVRIWWNLNQDGVRYPSRRKPKPEDDKPGGYAVLPGKYKLVFTWKGNRDSTLVSVHADPRLKISTGDLQAKQAAYDDFYKVVKVAADAFDRLQDAKQSIKLANDALANAPDSLKKAVADQGKILTDSLAALEKRFMQPEGLKGIQRDPDNINGLLFAASGYIGAADGAPNQAAKLATERARREVVKTVEDINRFFERDFAPFGQKVEAAEFSIFKKYEPLKVD